MFVLDTNVVSDLRRPGKANVGVRVWSSTTPIVMTFLSAITILELEQGALLAMRNDAVHGRYLRAWIDDYVLPRYAGRILVVDTIIAQRCAALHVPNPGPERDALIAATALVHGMTVVTRNVADFRASGVPLLNPWT